MTERERAQDAELLPCPFCGSTPILHQATPESPAHRPVECSNHTCCMSYMWPDREVWQARRPDARDETIRRLREALQWYLEEVEAMAANIIAKKTESVMASAVVLSLDAGKRARAALKDAP